MHQEKVVSPFTVNPWGLDINWIFVGLMLGSPRKNEAPLVTEGMGKSNGSSTERRLHV